jgi:tetratricopeptide (TPR) repeat protein
MVLASLTAALATAPAAQAQTFSEPALEALYVAERNDELRRIVVSRVAAKADDEQAVLGLALVSLEANDAAARKAAIAAAEACVERNAKATACQWALGSVLGIQAMSEGMMAVARNLGRVRDSLIEAQTLAPGWWPARSSLAEFYLIAPGMMGGSKGKAEALARSAPSPAHSQALLARIAVQEERHEQALTMLLAHKPGQDAALDSDVRGWGRGAAFGLLNAGHPAKARPYFERVMREQPDDAMAPYGLARVLAESGSPADALPLYERAAKGKGAETLPIAYRAGIAQQMLGQTDTAKASYKRFIAAGKGQKSAMEDARKRLAELGG